MTSSAPMTDDYAEMLDAAIRRSGIPSKYRDVQPDESGLVLLSPWLYLTGCMGSGKTYRACQIAKAWIVKGAQSAGGGRFWTFPRARFTTAQDYLETIKAGYGSRDDHDVADQIRNSRFLVLDDLGQEVPSKWAVAEIYRLINHRYNEQLPTVITSQYPRSAIARKLAEQGGKEQALSIASRLAESCEVKDMGNVDRRIQCR